MDFGRKDRDDELIQLLGRLKDVGPEYPSSMYSQRRAAVMAGFAALQLGAAVVGLSLLGHLVHIVKGMGVVEKIILGVEVAAVTGLTAYGAATAYVYRNEIRQVLFSSTQSSNTPFPSLSVPPSANPFTGGPAVGPGTPTPTPTGTVTVTVPPYLGPTNAPPNPYNTPVAPTNMPPPTKTPPLPVPTDDCGRNGKCLGHTKTPRPTPSGGGNKP